MSDKSQNSVDALNTVQSMNTVQSTNNALIVPSPTALSVPTKKGLIPWKKGQSGNPGGRPKGLASVIRERSLNGKVLIDFLFDVVDGTIKGQTRDRLTAAQILLDRGYGKAVETSVQVQLDAKNGETTTVLEDLADAELESMARQLKTSNTSPVELAPLMLDDAMNKIT